ncbi:MAG: hypothetical protein DRG83_14840, partial [Deltaproteobacteria bacterium]
MQIYGKIKTLKKYACYLNLTYKRLGFFPTLCLLLRGILERLWSRIVYLSSLLDKPHLFERYYLSKSEPNSLAILKKDVKPRIGIIRIGGFGDAVVLTAFAKSVKEKWPKSNIYLFVRSESQKQLLMRNKTVYGVFVLSNDVRLNGWLALSMAKQLIENNYL